PSTGPITSNGTQFNIPGLLKFDELRVIVKSFTGTVNGENLAALAEVETNARISFYEIIGIKQISSIADKFSLSQNFTNPFNPITKIRFSIPALKEVGGMKAHLVVYDILGREDAVLVNESLAPGVYEKIFDGSNLASGIYFYRLTVGDKFTDVKKMVLLK